MSDPRVLALALGPVTRSLRWRPLLGAGGVAATLLWLLRPDDGDPAVLLGLLRLGGFLLAAGAAFFLDDDAGGTLACSPTALWQRRGLRLAVLAGVLTVLWGLLAGMVSALAGASGVPLAAATLEGAGMVAFALAVAAVAAPRAPDERGGVAGGPALTLLVLGGYLGQMRWPRYLTLFPVAPGDPGWAPAHLRWAVLLAVAVTVLAVTSADPARRRVWRYARQGGVSAWYSSTGTVPE
jgi:hypothetical protein